jgi:hypothetical protein
MAPAVPQVLSLRGRSGAGFRSMLPLHSRLHKGSD